MRGVVIVLGSMVGIVVLVVVVGLLLPQGHQSSVRAHYAAPPEEVWSAISDVEGAAGWRSDIDSVRRLPADGGGSEWQEHGPHGDVGYELIEVRPGEFMLARIADDEEELPYTGAWRWQLMGADGGGSLLTITENGEVRNPVFRFVARFLMGYHGAMETYMRDLGARLGEDVLPERLPPAPYDSAFGR